MNDITAPYGAFRLIPTPTGKPQNKDFRKNAKISIVKPKKDFDFDGAGSFRGPKHRTPQVS